MDFNYFSTEYKVTSSKVKAWDFTIHYKAYVQPVNEYEPQKIYIELDYFYENAKDVLKGRSEKYAENLRNHIVKSCEKYVIQALKEGYTYRTL